MDGDEAFKLLRKQALRIVDDVMHGEDVGILIYGHLGMERDHKPSGAVVVDDKIMNTRYLGEFLNKLLYSFDEFTIGGLAEQGRDGLLQRTDAGIDDEGRNENTAVTVDIDLEEMCDKARNEYNACCDAVGAGVERGCAEGCGFNLLSDGFIVEDHVELNEY